MPAAIGLRLSRLLSAYYFGPDHPLKLRLWSWFRRSTGYPLLTTRYCERGWLALDERDYVQRRILTNGLYEPEVWNALFAVASTTEVVWDIGAHVGAFTVRSMLDPKVAAVHAFEPDPVTRRSLQLNVALNQNVGANCFIHEEALGADVGESLLHRGPLQNLGMSSIASKPSPVSFAVKRTSIDELVFGCGMTPPSLVKVDVEGSEGALISGATRVLSRYKPKAIAFEAKADRDGRLIDPSIAGALRAAGYEITWIQRPGAEMWSRENYLALHVGG